MLYLHSAYTRIVVIFMTCFYIVSVLNKPHIHHRLLIYIFEGIYYLFILNEKLQHTTL
jgi:hypothetical protein